MSRQVSRGSAGEFQADEQAGVARLRWQVSKEERGGCYYIVLREAKQIETEEPLDPATERWLVFS